MIKMWNVVHGSFGAHGLGVHDEPIRFVSVALASCFHLSTISDVSNSSQNETS